jgi:hypothetical protein
LRRDVHIGGAGALIERRDCLVIAVANVARCVVRVC